MKEQFLIELENQFSGAAEKHFILAVSGGVDSMVLARLFNEAGVSFSIAHCNFKLRGVESDEDEKFVATLASNLGVRFYHKSFQTAGYADEKGISIQMAARELRYNWFNELLLDENSVLATAHHANDVAETILFNLTKGTGLAGLHGIKKFNGKIIRPILWAQKNEIIEFAESVGITWREDVSNENSRYHRNRLRNKVIPQLEEINPAFIPAITRTAERLADAENLIDHLISSFHLIRSDGQHQFIAKHKLKDLPGRATIMYRLISPMEFSYTQVDQILSSIDSVGATFHTKAYVINVDRDELVISPSNSSATNELLINIDEKQGDLGRVRFKWEIADKEIYNVEPDTNIAAIDFAKLSFPLVIRKYKNGERFRPLGMTGTKLISDFLIDTKVPMNLKQEQLVVVSGNEVVWLVSKRLDDRYKVTESTKTVFEIRLENT